MLELKTVFLVILTLLNTSHVPKEKVIEGSCYLYTLSESMVAYADESVTADELIAVAYHESKFSIYSVGEVVVSHKGACGPYQQIAKWAFPVDVPKPTCSDLHDPWEASYRAYSAIKHMKQAKSVGYLKNKEGGWACHYSAGINCNKAAFAYEVRHKRIKKRVRRVRRKMAKEVETFKNRVLFSLLESYCTFLF